MQEENSRLTREQAHIVEYPLGARLLVTGGPGTGKTHVLAARLEHLLQTQELKPSRDILVLSFSRAATRAIAKRVRDSSSAESRFVQARTFDSFATRLLLRFVPEDGCLSDAGDYDRRIERCIEAIRSVPEVQENLRQLRHLFVDEIQDLVAVRRRLVEAIIETAEKSGLTLLGDRAQAIYDDLDSTCDHEPLTNWLRARFQSGLQEVELLGNHRATTSITGMADTVRPKLDAVPGDAEAASRELEDLIHEVPPLARVEYAQMLSPVPGTTAYLCYTNGGVLVTSRELWNAGARNVQRRAATDPLIPSWIGRLFYDCGSLTMGRSAFTDLWQKRCGESDGDSPADAWSTLKAIEGAPLGDSVSLSVVAHRIRTGFVPDSVSAPEEDKTIVSTVHRAKGLEFDRVVMVDDSRLLGDLRVAPRVVFVAMTRATKDIRRCGMTTTDGYLRRIGRFDRWVVKHGKGQLREFEVKPSDSSCDRPVSSPSCGYSPLELQTHIGSEVSPGAPVTLFLQDESGDYLDCRYLAVSNGFPLATMKASFSAQLAEALRWHGPSRGSRLPISIEDLRVEAVETVAGPEGEGRAFGLGAPSLWLRVRIAGLGILRFG